MALQVREYSERNLEHSQVVFQTVWFFMKFRENVLARYEHFMFSLLEAGVGLISV